MLAAGCGDEEGSAEDTIETSSLGKAEFTKRAEAICVRGNEGVPERLGAYISRRIKDGDQTEAELVADAVRIVVLPRVQGEIEEIRDLGAPSGDEEQIEAFLVAMQQSVDSLDAKERLSLLEVGRGFRQPGVMAREYGMVGCAFN